MSASDRALAEAYRELAEVAAQWQRSAEWERARRVRAERAVRRAISQAPRVNGRQLKLTSGSRSLTDTWPGVPMPPASNDEPIPLVRVKTARRSSCVRQFYSWLAGASRSGGT